MSQKGDVQPKVFSLKKKRAIHKRFSKYQRYKAIQQMRYQKRARKGRQS